MIINKNNLIILIVVCSMMFLLQLSVFADTNLEFVEKEGFTFEYPSDWKYIDMGSSNYGDETTIGHSQIITSPDAGAATIFIMVFPKFTIDLGSADMNFNNFMKLSFESFLEDSGITGLNTEESEAEFSHGVVNGYVVSDDSDTEVFKIAMICGDFKNGKAAIVIMTMKLAISDDAIGDKYIEQVEQITKSLTFPGGWNKK